MKGIPAVIQDFSYFQLEPDERAVPLNPLPVSPLPSCYSLYLFLPSSPRPFPTFCNIVLAFGMFYRFRKSSGFGNVTETQCYTIYYGSLHTLAP